MPQVRKSRALPLAAVSAVVLTIGVVGGGVLAASSIGSQAGPAQLTKPAQPAESVVAAYHTLERDLVRLTASGERLVGRGDACLGSLRQDAPQALELCRGFLGDAVAWMEPLGAAADRLRGLDASLGDRTLIAVGAGRDEALAAVAGLAGVLTRLSLQIAEAEVALSLPLFSPQVAAGPI